MNETTNMSKAVLGPEWNETTSLRGADGLKYPFSSKSVWSDEELLYNAGRYWNVKMISVIERKKINI